MILIKVELHSAVTGQVTEIASMKIANDGRGTRTRGNYNVWLAGDGGRPMGQCRVTNWPRTAKHVWDLIAEALRVARRAS